LATALGQTASPRFNVVVSTGQLALRFASTVAYFSLDGLDIVPTTAAPTAPLPPPPPAAAPPGAAAAHPIVLENFDGATIPTNGDGYGYPYNAAPNSGAGGVATYSLDPADSISGNSVKAVVTSGELYAQFNPYNYA